MAAVLIAIGIAVLIALSYVANEEHRRQRAAWLAAGRRVGLEPIGQGRNSQGMWGQVNDQLVRTELVGDDNGLQGTLTVGSVEPSLVIKAESFATKAVLGPGLECGDTVFDDAILVRSNDEHRAFAALDHSTTLAPDSPSDGALSTADDMGTLAIAEPEKEPR